jgi:hypothetical protein
MLYKIYREYPDWVIGYVRGDDFTEEEIAEFRHRAPEGKIEAYDDSRKDAWVHPDDARDSLQEWLDEWEEGGHQR